MSSAPIDKLYCNSPPSPILTRDHHLPPLPSHSLSYSPTLAPASSDGVANRSKSYLEAADGGAPAATHVAVTIEPPTAKNATRDTDHEDEGTLRGLSSAEAEKLVTKYGLNEIPEEIEPVCTPPTSPSIQPILLNIGIALNLCNPPAD